MSGMGAPSACKACRRIFVSYTVKGSRQEAGFSTPGFETNSAIKSEDRTKDDHGERGVLNEQRGTGIFQTEAMLRTFRRARGSRRERKPPDLRGMVV